MEPYQPHLEIVKPKNFSLYMEAPVLPKFNFSQVLDILPYNLTVSNVHSNVKHRIKKSVFQAIASTTTLMKPAIQNSSSRILDGFQTMTFGQMSILIESAAFLLIACLCGYQIWILIKNNTYNKQRSRVHVSHNYLDSRDILCTTAASTTASVSGKPSSTLYQLECRSFPVSLTGEKARALFIILLFFANIIRSISLLLIYLWWNPSTSLLVSPPSSIISQDNISLSGSTLSHTILYDDDFNMTDLIEWDVYILHTLPTLFFLASYSIAVLFWAQMYYASILVVIPLLKPLFSLVCFTIMVTFFIVAIATRLTEQFLMFRNISLGLIGSLHFLVAMCFVYFGTKVASQLAQQSHPTKSKDSIIRRVILLSIFCPIIFAFRGAFCLLFIAKVLPRYHPYSISRFTWDALLLLLSELIPDILILTSFWSSGLSSITTHSSISDDMATPMLRMPLLDPQSLAQFERQFNEHYPQLDSVSRQTDDEKLLSQALQELQQSDDIYTLNELQELTTPTDLYAQSYSTRAKSSFPTIYPPIQSIPIDPTYCQDNWNVHLKEAMTPIRHKQISQPSRSHKRSNYFKEKDALFWNEYSKQIYNPSIGE